MIISGIIKREKIIVVKVCDVRRKTFLFLLCFILLFLLRSADVRRKTFLFLLCFFLLRSADVRRKTFLFLLCFLLRSADYVGRPFCFCCVSYYFYSFFYFSLKQIFSNDFFVISQPISIKFGRYIVLDETKSLNIISSQ